MRRRQMGEVAFSNGRSFLPEGMATERGVRGVRQRGRVALSPSSARTGRVYSAALEKNGGSSWGGIRLLNWRSSRAGRSGVVGGDHGKCGWRVSGGLAPDEEEEGEAE